MFFLEFRVCLVHLMEVGMSLIFLNCLQFIFALFKIYLDLQTSISELFESVRAVVLLSYMICIIPLFLTFCFHFNQSNGMVQQ